MARRRRLDFLKLREGFEKRYEDFQEEVYESVRAEIIRVCDERNWDFRNLYMLRLFPRGGDEELDETVPGVKEVIDLVCWADDLCGFPDCMYENGVWTP